MISRDKYAKAALGPTLLNRIKEAKIAVIGAGGIGCELLKNLVLSGFGNIHVVDLDTIDLSNLNRQFLFGMQHIKKSKAIVAIETAGKFNPNVHVEAHHANIKDPKFGIKWFQQFTLVFNALDNLEARRHVNKMCLAANVPLIESGTTGFNGQVQLIEKSKTECYDCTTKPVPKSFPVCTIRSTPSQPIHCIVWAKSYLFGELFSVSEEDTDDFDHSKDSENAEEIANLKAEAKALKKIRESLTSEHFANNVFQKVFYNDIVRLRSMKDMWKSRTPPEPLNFEEISKKSSSLKNVASDDQKVWSLEENLAVFTDSLVRLSRRVVEQKASGSSEEITFDKDDEDTLDFVAASANLRSIIFKIECKSKFDIKQMAGNIIPAIATTNAITAGLCVLEAYKVLREKANEAKMVFLSLSTDRALTSEPLRKPNPGCEVCGVVRVDFAVDTGRTMLKDLVDALQDKLGYGESLSIIHENLIYDEDFDDNLEKSFSDLSIADGSFVTIIDDSDEKSRINLVLQIAEQSFGHSEASFQMPDVEIPLKPEVLKETMVLSGLDLKNGETNGAESTIGKKRKIDEVLDGSEETSETPKKSKVSKENDVIVIDDGYIEID